MNTIVSQKQDQSTPSPSTTSRLVLSIVTPAYNEVENLPTFYERLCKTMQSIDMDREWLVVDDHPGDGTFAFLYTLARKDPRVRGRRLARNFGAHAALMA